MKQVPTTSVNQEPSPWAEVAVRLVRWAGSAVIGLLSFAAATAPLYVVYRANSGSAGISALMRAGEGRSVVGAELTEVTVSHGFDALARTVALAPERPAWETVRSLMEREGLGDLQYTLRVLSRLDDGGSREIAYVRRPCRDPRPHVEEFFQLLAIAGPSSEDGRLDLPSGEIDLRPDLIDGSADLVIQRLLKAAADGRR